MSIEPLGASSFFLRTLVADAIAVEPVLTRKFPANGEINREFFNLGPDRALEHPIRPMISGLLSQIPDALEQGIISAEQGILFQKQGIFPVKFEIGTG